MRYIETHCHLDMLKSFPLEETILKAKQIGVEKIITIGVEPENLDPIIQIASEHEIIYCTQGVHPHDASKIDEFTYQKIKTNAQNKKVVAIGEIGLDYYYNNSPKEIQQKRFEEQLQIACDLNLPVVIHTRDADEDTISILKNFEKKLTKKGVIHSFTSEKKLAEYVLEQNFYIGFNGIITFPKAQNVRDILEFVPENRILIETDSPFLTPVPHRGKENGPYYLNFIAAKISDIKKIPIENLTEAIYQNSLSLFNFVTL